MKKLIKLFILGFILITINGVVQAQNISFKGAKLSAEDAQVVSSILSKVGKENYNVGSSINGKTTQYGASGLSKTKIATAKSLSPGGNVAWVEEIRSVKISSTINLRKEDVLKLQAIQAKYRQ